MQAYVLSVLGIVIASCLVEIVLPSGQTAKYIKSITAIFVIYVLINPIVVFLKNDFDVNKYIISTDVKFDQGLLNSLYIEQVNTRQIEIEKQLENEGFEGVKVTFLYEIVESEIKIKKIKINTKNLVITSNNSNINKYQFIRQVVMSNVAVKEEDVIFE